VASRNKGLTDAESLRRGEVIAADPVFLSPDLDGVTPNALAARSEEATKIVVSFMVFIVRS
jgi:hypothetical protein